MVYPAGEDPFCKSEGGGLPDGERVGMDAYQGARALENADGTAGPVKIHARRMEKKH